MRRALTWIAGLVGIAALARMLRARRHAAPAVVQPPPPLEVDDPAEELRRALARSRAARDDDREPAPAEPAALDERRARVHAKAQEAIDAMRGTDGAA